MTTYKTLTKDEVPTVRKLTYFTAGARAESETVPNPAALTAIACKSPMMNLTPSGIESIAGFPMSRTIKKNQSVKLEMKFDLG